MLFPSFSFRSPSRLAAVVLLAASLAGCGAGGFSDMTASVANSAGNLMGARPAGSPIDVQMFVASTRRDDFRVGDAVSDGGVHHSLNLVSLPANHEPGVIERPSFGKPDRARHIVLSGGRNLTPQRFSDELASHVSGRVGADRDVLLFVHGFNTSLDEARFRLAQIVADARFGGVPVLFTWPSQSNLLSYESDKERATASRDALAELMGQLAATPGVGRVHVLAHSMGSWLAMEALRQNAIAGQPDLGGRLGEVMLAAPDIDLAVFRQQMAKFGGRAHVSVIVSRGDRALGLSSRIAGDRPRVGALDPTKPGDGAELARLGVKVYDVSSYSRDFVGHSVFADAPAVIRGIGAQLATSHKDETPGMAGAAVLDEEPAPPAQTQAIVAAPLAPPPPQ